MLRFAVLSALCLGVAAAGILAVTRHLNTVEAQRNAARQAEFVAETVLGEELNGSDFRRAVSPERRAELDRLFRDRVLPHGVLLVTLSRSDRVVTYATDHRLIGRRIASAERTDDALTGTLTSEVTAIPDARFEKGRAKVLRSYVPLSIRGGTRGVVGMYQDYSPIARAARAAFLPVAGILELVLLVLYVLLVPLLARVSKRIRKQVEQIEYQAFHDDLTDLPNRLQFRKRIGAAVAAAKEDRSELAVLLLDLDRFKEINDTLGHRSGDQLLEELGARLRGLLDDDLLLARLGGDEFGIVAPGASADLALELAAEIRTSLEAPFVVNSVPLAVEASVGVAMYPRDSTDVDTLLQHADIAMYAAKDRRLGIVQYEPDLDTSTAAQLSLMSEFRRALDEHEIVLYFQPKADLRSGEIGGAETLVRWEHPVRGLLQPGEFLPFAERTGVSRTLSRYVLTGAVRQLREWGEQGIDLALAVNLTMFDLLDLTLPEEVAVLLEREGVEPHRLELEITESVIMADPVRVREVVGRLKAIGVRLAIDDFGTGYSSLAYLKSLPVDVLKIDRSFVMGMDADESDRAIVRSTTELAHNLGLAVIAEGVESEEVWRELQQVGCDAAQGFYIGRPLPADELLVAIAAWNERRSSERLPLDAATSPPGLAAVARAAPAGVV